EQSERVLCREQKWRSSKPPVTKVKLGFALKQHELSVIPEVDTPQSCSFSSADKTDSGGGDSAPILTPGEFAHVQKYSHALHEDSSLPLSITNYEEQSSPGSSRPAKQSSRLLQDMLLLTAEYSCD
ncbi:CE295 protein, partial [Bucco capensis]|nr:CE295 protein [Bucco capensis]